MNSLTERVYAYCCEDPSLIENYQLAKADNFKGWHCHHKMELVVTGAVVNASAKDLQDWNLYYNRPADELIFLKASEHRHLHMVYGDKYEHKVPLEHNYFHTHKFCGKENGFYGKHHTPETLAKISRLGSHHTNETKLSISNTTKARMAEVKAAYKEYKLNGGTNKWNQFQKEYRR